MKRAAVIFRHFGVAIVDAVGTVGELDKSDSVPRAILPGARGPGVGSGAFAGFVLGWGPIALWGGLVLGLSVAAIALSIRTYRAMKRVAEGGQILEA